MNTKHGPTHVLSDVPATALDAASFSLDKQSTHTRALSHLCALRPLREVVVRMGRRTPRAVSNDDLFGLFRVTGDSVADTPPSQIK